jgi:membrane protein DedA with SNARE-associated domain
VTRLVDQLLSVPGWLVCVVAGALVFAEDALFVGFVIPGETVAVLAGVAAYRGHVPLAAVLATVVAAAVIGDTVGYEVGRHLGTRLLGWRRLDGHREQLDRAQDLLARRGGGAVFLGRFVAFFRAVMPALAGSSGMPYLRFLAWNAAGGVTWGAAAVLLGYFAGASYRSVEKVAGRGAAAVVAAVVVLGLLVWRVRKHRAEARDQSAAQSHGAHGDPSGRGPGDRGGGDAD